MAKAPLQQVRMMTLRELAEQWAPEAQIPESVMLRELRLAVINIPRLERGEGLIDPIPPDDELPDPDERVDRQWLKEFLGKQEGWREPDFWFGRIGKRGDLYPGRPTVKPAIVQELKRRAEAGELEETLAEQARVLFDWAQERFPGDTRLPGHPKSVENQIRAEFRRLKGSKQAH